jgi:UDP-glucose 4-epimerase
MILITGGMGFIGMHVARELAARDDVVLGYNRTVRSAAEMVELIGREVPTVRVDVASPYSLARAVAEFRPDSIVHLAVPALGAFPPAEETLTNVTGLVNVLEAARNGGVSRVSLASSLAVYAGLSGGPFAETRELPVASTSATSAMKKAEEVLALHYADRTGLDLLLLRIAVIYGPLYSTLANLAGRLTHLAVRGSLPERIAGPWTTSQLPGGLDLCYVGDCARAVATIHTAARTAHRIYNVGAGQSVTPTDLLDAVAKAVPGAVLPEELRETTPPTTPQNHMDISRIRDEFGLAPRFALEDGIRDYAEWLRDHAL